MHAQRNAPGKCYKICHIFGREKKILVVVTLDKISKGKNYAGFSYTSEVSTSLNKIIEIKEKVALLL